ncbi:lysosomal acid glucosylceramidase-like isoform X2 [Tenebrio molitor]|uniref:lysosomal acid glucosylceramidase-like isoform X2 n=1 Tax=Tenebrio molitor TaxID=7067 RepID=UPI0036247C05
MLTILLFLGVLTGGRVAEECHRRDYGNGGHVCVCTSTRCDTVPRPTPVARPNFLRYTSNKAGLRFEKSTGSFITTDRLFDNKIVVNANDKYQTMMGWGGAFTDFTGININSLDEQAQDKLLESYFSDHGIEYNLCRVPIGSTDFSKRAYSYADSHADAKLTHFKLAPEDFQFKIPFIQRAKNLSQGKLELFASAWAAPKWMKTNGQYAGFGFLHENMYQAWVEYYVKFLDSYQEQGIEFWGLTTGNEPSLGIIPLIKISSVGWLPKIMETWIRCNLSPTIRNSSHSAIKIITLDDQRFFLPWFVNIVFKHRTTRDYVDGIAVHWYYDTTFPPSLLRKTHENFPEKFVLATEACLGNKPGQKDVDLGSWQRGERYAANIIEDVNHWITGWVDWNMALNLKGGPTYSSNFIDSPIIVNSSANEFYKQPMYYNLGHFSKFVPRGSVRLGSTGFDNQVPVAAFRRPDNGTIVVILNKKEQVVPITVVDDSRGSAPIELSERSISTFLYW